MCDKPENCLVFVFSQILKIKFCTNNQLVFPVFMVFTKTDGERFLEANNF
jgi:hypothetical protein